MSHNDMTTAEKNLHQAAEVETSSAWTVARLIAASVETASHGGDRTSKAPQGAMKIGIKPAAKVMGRSDNTIRAYLAAWSAAAADGLCAPSSDLTPDDGWTAAMPDAADWEKYKQANSHSATRQVETVPAKPLEVARTMSPEEKQEFVSQSIREDVTVAKAANSALEDRSEADERILGKVAHSKERIEAERKQDSSAQAITVVVALGRARRAVKDAHSEMAGVSFTESEKSTIGSAVEGLREALVELTGTFEGVDWDAELTKITGGGSR